MRPDEYEDIEEFIDHLNKEEEALDMHYSLYSIPKVYRNNPETTQEHSNAN